MSLRRRAKAESKKTRQIPWRTCEHTGKRRYETRKDARRAAAAADIHGLSAYECSSCGGFHNGHLPKMVRDGDAVRWDMQPRVEDGT